MPACDHPECVSAHPACVSLQQLQVLRRGATVEITTTNGGRGVVTLMHDYRPTYYTDFVDAYGHGFAVGPERLKSIRPMWPDTLTPEQSRMLQFAALHDWGYDAQPHGTGINVGVDAVDRFGVWTRERRTVQTMQELRDWAGY